MIDAAHRIIAGAQRLVCFSGAGLSAESGIPTFRDADCGGLWAKFDPMELASPEGFARDPKLVLISSEVAGTVLAWNTESFPKGKAPTRWEDMMDLNKFPGTRSFWKHATGTLETAFDRQHPGATHASTGNRAEHLKDAIRRNGRDLRPLVTHIARHPVAPFAWEGFPVAEKYRSAPAESTRKHQET